MKATTLITCHLKKILGLYLLLTLLSCQTDIHNESISQSLIQASADNIPPIQKIQKPQIRNLIMIVDDGETENPLRPILENHTKTHISISLSWTLLNALKSKTPVPILVSESIVQSMSLKHQISVDLVDLSVDDLKEKYKKFSFDIEKIQHMSTQLFKDYQKLKDTLTTMQSSTEITEEMWTTLKSNIDDSTQLKSKLEKDNDITHLFSELYLVFYDYFIEDNWFVYQTKQGDYVFFPKKDFPNMDDISTAGFSVENLIAETPDDTPIQSSDITIESVIRTKQKQSDTRRMIDALEDLIKKDSPAPVNIFLTGHGGPPTAKETIKSSVEDMITTLDEHLKEFNEDTKLGGKKADYIKAQIEWNKNHQDLVTSLTNDKPSTVAGFFAEVFNKKLLPVLKEINTKTLSYSSCVSGDINRLRAFKSDQANIEAHPFTIVNGALSIGSTRDQYIPYNKTATLIYDLYKNKKTITESISDLSYLNQIKHPSRYLYTLKQHNLNEAITYYFEEDEGEEFFNVPTVKLATTNYWITITQVRESIMEITKTKDIATFVDEKSFHYTKQKKGALLFQVGKVYSPIIIESGSAQLPIFIPMANEPRLFINEIRLTSTSVSIEQFIQQSLLAFYEKLKGFAESIAKGLFIKKIRNQNGDIMATNIIVTKNGAHYTTDEKMYSIGQKTGYKATIIYSNENNDLTHAKEVKTVQKTLEQANAALETYNTTFKETYEHLKNIK